VNVTEETSVKGRYGFDNLSVFPRNRGMGALKR
jgi:hypothetical protein